mmetsp:Transcript_76065/g.68189  ORF Transcript_76065/g.68189 Transcript_76065/m.68189 type:complete len:84 (+) Transcript_76065:47-298(+)
MPGGVHPKTVGVTPIKRQMFRPLYPINAFYRFLPCVGLFVVASAYNTIVPEYERLWWRLEQNAYTYEHPMEIAAREKAEAESE